VLKEVQHLLLSDVLLLSRVNLQQEEQEEEKEHRPSTLDSLKTLGSPSLSDQISTTTMMSKQIIGDYIFI